MATTRRKIRSLTDLNAKQTLQKVDGNDVIFEASGSLANGKVTVNVPLSASAIAVTGASGLTVNNGGVTINNNTGLVVNSNGITVNSGGASITGDLVAGANNVGALRSRVSTQLSGSTETSGSLTVGGNGGLSVTGGSISGSSTLQAGGNLTVGGNTLLRGNLDVEGNMVVRGQPTIINTEVLEVKDNIIVINKLSGSEAAYDTATGGLYVNRGNFETASLLWVSSSNDWKLQSTIGGTPTSADLSVNWSACPPGLINNAITVSYTSPAGCPATPVTLNVSNS